MNKFFFRGAKFCTSGGPVIERDGLVAGVNVTKIIMYLFVHM